MISVEYLLVAFTDLTLTAFDIPKLRGYFSRKYADEPLFHNHPEPLKDYRFTKVHHIVLCGKEKIETRHWHEVKRAVYNYILKHKPGFQLAGSFRHSKDKTEFRTPLTLDDGYFTESNLGSSDMIRHARKAMQAAGYDPVKDLLVGFSKIEKTTAHGQ